MRVFALLPAVAAGVTLFNKGNVDGMRDVFLNIAKQAQESGGKISQETKDIVQEMLDTINSTLVPALIEDQESAQKLHDIAFNAIEACATQRNHTIDNSIAQKDGAQQSAESDFDNCKNIADAGGAALLQKDVPGQAGAHDYGYNFTRVWNDESAEDALGATSHEKHAADDYKSKCEDLDNYVKTFTVKEQKNDWCEDPNPNVDWSDIFRTNNDMVTKSHTWFHFMDEFTKNHAAIYKQKREACHEARHRHQTRVAECHRLQHIFESDYCSWANSIDENCHYYDTCYDNTLQAFNIQNASVAAMEVQFKAQQHALECLLCYGDQILQDSTDLSKCDNSPCVNCEKLCINYTIPHPKIPCDPVETRPCDDAWCNEHYGDYTKENCIPVDTCIACSDPALVSHTFDT